MEESYSGMLLDELSLNYFKLLFKTDHDWEVKLHMCVSDHVCILSQEIGDISRHTVVCRAAK